MMRTALTTLFAFTLIGATVAQEKKADWTVQPVPHETVKKNRSRTGPAIAGKAFRYLTGAQNNDGSFGSTGAQCKATALAVIAFTRHMERGEPGSKYEDTIKNACAWLRQAKPETDEDRLAVVIAIAGLYAHEHNSKTPYKGSGADDRRMMNALLADIKSPKDNAWFDFLAISRLPEDVTRPAWSVNNDALQEEYMAKSSTSAFSTQDEYLNMYLVTVAKWKDRKTRTSHMKEIVQQLKDKQGGQGAFTTSNEGDTPIVTALSAMCFTLDYTTAHRFFSSIQASDGKVTD